MNHLILKSKPGKKAFDKSDAFLLFFFCSPFLLHTQSIVPGYEKYGTLLRFQIENGMFPDSLRSNGHGYDGTNYPYQGHYDDNSVFVFIPDYFKAGKKTDIVVHFHGWYNNLDSVVKTYQLIEQFHAAGRNAILILPQGPKNAPDSYGGKLEQAGVFRLFLGEVLTTLTSRKIVGQTTIGNVVISGHSGAYRVMAHILLHGGVPVQEVYLFDGLYGQLEKYGHWLSNNKGRFINIYTADGGTFEDTQDFMTDLRGWGIPFLAAEESGVNEDLLKKQRILMIYTSLSHNEVIHVQSNFYKYLTTSFCLKKG
jgi:hypothetical protein